MKIAYPSVEFDDAVAAVCHGLVSDEQMRALSELLRDNSAARDEYILRLELHSRLASDPDLFASAAADIPPAASERELTLSSAARSGRRRRGARRRTIVRAFLMAASFALIAAAAWWWLVPRSAPSGVTISKAVAMLNQTADAQWDASAESPRLGAPLEPGWLKFESGLAQVVFYSGTRVVIQGPAEFQLISPGHASCRLGKITAEVPPQARGFRIDTPHGTVTDLGTSFGVEVQAHGTELHVFKGSVSLQTHAQGPGQILHEGAGAVIERAADAPRLVAADRAAYASLFDLQQKSMEAGARRLNRWRAASRRLDGDPWLLAHFDFEQTGSSPWQLPNAAQGSAGIADATIVGCQWVKGRWPEKRALQFQGVSDRVRLNVPGEFDAVTLTAWVRVQGLDRQLNSLFMCDGFGSGTVHWLIRDDGVLGLTVVGERAGDFQIVKSPPVLTLDQFGMWLHLAVVLDGRTGRVAHYVNGQPVSEAALRIGPPYRFGTAELGNWNAKGFPEHDPFMIRNFSGAMDEFCLFSRALGDREIHALYSEGKLELDAIARSE
jgi:hypothetical protein